MHRLMTLTSKWLAINLAASEQSEGLCTSCTVMLLSSRRASPRLLVCAHATAVSRSSATAAWKAPADCWRDTTAELILLTCVAMVSLVSTGGQDTISCLLSPAVGEEACTDPRSVDNGCSAMAATS